MLDVNGDKAKDFIVSDDEIKDHVALSKSSEKLDDLLNNKRLLKDDLNFFMYGGLLTKISIFFKISVARVKLLQKTCSLLCSACFLMFFPTHLKAFLQLSNDLLKKDCKAHCRQSTALQISA